MLFNSLTFAVFFVAVAAIYWALPGNRARLAWLVIAGWLFYAAWNPIYWFLFVGMTAYTYGGAYLLGALRARRMPTLPVLSVIVTVNLLALGLFKYTGFFAGELARFVGLFAGKPVFALPLADFILPLGISFHAFQLISYAVDVHRGDCEAIRNPLKMALFGGFFPQLIAGPIVRKNEFLPQLGSARLFDRQQVLFGLDLFARGLAKKMLIADQLAPFVDQMFAAPAGLGPVVILGVYAYAIQIFCDFSGYTDMGRGVAHMLGYELPENFERPYLAVNIIDFWRRWHITLSRWLQDYLYIPLGGSRCSPAKRYRNLLVTMALGGLWHGASWNFVIWGLFHGLLLMATRAAHDIRGTAPAEPLFGGRVYRFASMLLTFHLVCAGWVFFRAESFGGAVAVFSELFARPGVAGFGAFDLLLLATGLGALVILQGLSVLWYRLSLERRRPIVNVLRPLAYAALILAVIFLCNRGAQAFIYFQF